MPRSTWFKALLLLVALWAPLSQAETGWQPIQETIRKSDKDNRQYQAIRLDNGMVVLLVSDPQAVKSLSALVVLQSVAYRRTIGLCRVCVSNERGASVGHGLPFAKQ
ncbi:hypothetical protein [Escherichia coli]|uniref:hypothetical protein n=1 Tax=Escherichia coli TaxID=562 RepID=UPI003D0DFD98